MADEINKVEATTIQPSEQHDFKKAHIGQNIAAIRRSRGISQEYVAVKMGKSQQSISNLELLEEVSEDTLAQIAKILGVTSEYIKNYDLERVITNNTQIINEGGKGGFNEYGDDHSITNSLDVIKYVVAENRSLLDRIIIEKDEVIRDQKVEIKLLRADIKRLNEELRQSKTSNNSKK